MRFSLIIPSLHLLILNLPSLDSDADAFHNGSFDAVKSLDHIQFANISSIDGNFVTRNTRFRKSFTHDVKPVALTDNSEDTVSSQLTPSSQGSRGKRQKRDSQEDELAQAEKNVTDLMSEIGNITEQLKEKEEQASEANKKYEESKAAVANWEDAEKARLKWESADKAFKRANASLNKAIENLKVANETLKAAEEKLKEVKGEPELLIKLTDEFKPLDAEHKALEKAIIYWEDELPLLQKAFTDADTSVSTYEAEVLRVGCKVKESKGPCEEMRKVLEIRINDRNTAQKAYGDALADNKAKTERLAVCDPEWNRLKAEIEPLEMNVPDNQDRIKEAEKKLNRTVKNQVGCLEQFKNALAARDEAAEKEKLAKQLYDDKASKVTADGAEVGNAFQAAKLKFDNANLLKEIVDEVLVQANAKVDALKQSKTKPKTGAALFIGVGAGGGFILIILIIGSILFAVKQRKSKVKEEPSPTINPEALKYEKVPSLDKTKQESASMSSSNQRATPAKSDANLSSTPATPAKSDTILKGGAALKRVESLTDLPVHRGPTTPMRPRPMAMPPTTNEKIAKDEIEYIEIRRPLINAIAKPTNSSKKTAICKLPSELKWAGPKKAIAMQFGGEKLDPLPEDEDVMLHNDQDDEYIDEDSEHTQYDHAAPNRVNKTGSDLLTEHAKDKTSVDDALKMATYIFIAVHRKLNFKFLALVQLAAAARDVFMKEKPLVECGLPANIFGDIHGQVGDAVRLINVAAWDPANPKSRIIDLNKQHFVFCGDYVDRGNRQVETLVLLFSLKIAYPNNVHILRGNHETRDINHRYGFNQELEDRYYEDGAKLYDVFNEVFDHLPFACLIGSKIPKPLSNINDSPLAQDILWADPMNGLSGTKPNEGRGISIHFGEDALEEAMARLGLILVNRGHQIPGNGFSWFGLKGLLCTVFTAFYASKKKNYSAAMQINEKGEKKMLVMFKGSANYGLIPQFAHARTHEANNERDDDYAVHKEEEQPDDLDQTRCM
ncbi:hypothetical protein PRIPAC_83663 [Pristionchus pacificus]|uniref:Serine/threonine-protein phosphatase n=1 Tax=Pristionchus pacificus TaxID=54126 RepID=A0A2A6BTK0_PRIPA|nr:hypothetical protein PRIPAC_83663 [Pristionchus pacificus]|eukprot:PDM69208.1 Calcineurin-like phosphoesterase [Pristionchus pacificus]